MCVPLRKHNLLIMGKTHQLFQDSWFHMNEETTPSSSSTITSSIGQESTLSNGSSSDDAASSASSSFSSLASFDLSEIMTQLPIKRGLSKFYKGKSESFTSLSRVTSIHDLAKKANQNRRNVNVKAAAAAAAAASQSIGTGLHSYNSYTLPRATIAKKNTTRGSSFSCKTHY